MNQAPFWSLTRLVPVAPSLWLAFGARFPTPVPADGPMQFEDTIFPGGLAESTGATYFGGDKISSGVADEGRPRF
jgi:hypothetical protein